ncbi:MAG: hypothetical protein CVU62_13325 [Deltaproteobacteria bacterium HGW-Deltaproteobacteria-2]|jgi:hypothetical protein|nr:MAG: hypothetical protein CVU62_13325 [Deltaproteobacteria bacterium HGW-Deltaproteobacteria-2]
MDKLKNGELMLVNAKQDVSNEVLSKIPDFKAALKLCKEISGLNDQQLCAALRIEPAQWSRIWSGQAHFPPEKVTCLMDLCGNWVPLRWLAMNYGQELKPTKTTLERENDELKAELEKKNHEMETIKNFLKEVKAA